jgi:hypothetical protein
MNIHELDGAGRPRVGWCFAPKGYLVAGDVMLAQKIALESVARWPWRTDFSCFVDFIAPDGRAENLRMK